jgi:radical SAM protein with 4Fe4S-binding SPASM domain
MVTAGHAARWTRRLLGALGDDLRGFCAAIQSRHALRPGLHTYSTSPPGGKRRFHLRVGTDGAAVLLVDVADAIHLNPAAALLVHLSLQNLPVERAAAALRGRFHKVGRGQSRSQAERIYALVDHLTNAVGPCTTCSLDQVQWSPLFSVPVTAPYKADLALRYGCNNACPHCYSQDRDHRSRLCGQPPFAVSQWQHVLKRLSAIGVPHVIFTGGEPTLVDGLTDLIRTAVGLGLVTGLNTNGRRLSDSRFCASLHAAGLDHVQITLESHRPAVHNSMTGADSFDETVRGIQNALAVGLHTITNTTLTRQNIDHAGQIVEFLFSLGLRTFAMNGMIYAGGGQTSCNAVPAEALAPVLADVRDRARARGMRFLWYTPTEYCRLSPVEWDLGPRRCNAGEYSICIEPNGDVLPCQSYYTSAGNILRDPWEQIWESELFLGFRRRVADPPHDGLPERCWSCPDLPLCAGGCRLERMKDEC